MMLVAFRSKLTSAAGDDYARMAAAMDAHARTFPGFVEVKDYFAGDGERLTLVWWADAETLGVWASDARHSVAQSIGRDRWYEY